MKLKLDGYYYPDVDTLLPNQRWAVDPHKLDTKELAQLFVDLWTVPQPEFRNGESFNLATAVLRIGHGRIGKRFFWLAAQRIIKSGHDELGDQAGIFCHD